MEELLAKIPGAEIRDYMREAMSCYMAGAYRGAVVLSYIALFDDLMAKLSELANVNATAKIIFTEATKKKTDQDVYESYLIDQLSSHNLISGLDYSFLTTLRTLRNKSAHPSGHTPSPEEARFIFFETIDRFLSRTVLSTTHLVDELLGRLKNTNFFPSTNISNVTNVVGDELANLHDAALPQLVAKITVAFSSPDQTTETNSSYFLIGLAKQDKSAANEALQKKLITPKADNIDYQDVIIQVLSANGKLAAGLSGTTIDRLRATLTKKICEITSTLSENNLIHPTFALTSIAAEMPNEKFIATFKPELEALFQKRAHSEFVVKLVGDKPSLLPIYLPALLARAGSSDFNTANSFSNSAETLDAPLSTLLSDESAFHLIVAIMKAADWGAWSAKGIANTKFAGIPLLRSKACLFITSNEVIAAAYIQEKLSATKPISEFVAVNLTNEEIS